MSKILLNFYQKCGHAIIEFDAEKPLDEVFEDFKKLVGIEVAYDYYKK